MSDATPGLFDPLFGTAGLLTERGWLQGMLEFEAALARAEARVGVIPAKAAPTIGAYCQVKRFDLAALARETATAGNPAIPLVKALTRLVAKEDAVAARYVHWGATSQDVMDTGLVLRLREFLALLGSDLDRLLLALSRLVEEQRATPLAGRTWLQQALPVTLGLKAAGWLDALKRHRDRLEQLRPRLLVLQFGGAAGTLASLGDRGLDVAVVLAEELDLALPDVPWHAARDRPAELATTLGLLTGTLGKMARDLSLMMQTEVGEALEPAGEGRGGSSTMPHKRNPLAAAVVLAAATRAPGLVATLLAAMVQEHERGLGGWQAEWQTLPELCRLTAGALKHMYDVLEGLELDPQRMRANLQETQGLILAEAVMMALGAQLGRLEAHDLVERACRRAVIERRHLRDVLAEEPGVTQALSAEALDRLFDPLNYLGVADLLIGRVLGKED